MTKEDTNAVIERVTRDCDAAEAEYRDSPCTPTAVVNCSDLRVVLARIGVSLEGDGVVERVARAICWGMAEEDDDCSSVCMRAKRCMADEVNECFKRDARAALKAIGGGSGYET